MAESERAAKFSQATELSDYHRAYSSATALPELTAQHVALKMQPPVYKKTPFQGLWFDYTHHPERSRRIAATLANIHRQCTMFPVAGP